MGGPADSASATADRRQDLGQRRDVPAAGAVEVKGPDARRVGAGNVFRDGVPDVERLACAAPCDLKRLGKDPRVGLAVAAARGRDDAVD